MKGLPVLTSLVGVLLFFVSVVSVLADTESAWQKTPADQKKALANDRRPPARKMPYTMLSPIRSEEIGAIRSVTPKKGEKSIALTFDLCELASSTSGCDVQSIGFLHEQQIKATFFASGKWLRTHARRAVQIMSDPLFEVANHAWTHGNCALLSSKGLRSQILWTQAQYELLREEILKKHEGTLPPVPKYFRPPYARCTKKALAEIAELGLRVVLWDVVAERGVVRSEQEAKKVANSVVAACKPGSILLFHANYVPTGTYLLLKEVVHLLKERGYQFVTVDELMQLGTPNRTMECYFSHRGDNVGLDKKFGIDGTGSRIPFTGE